MLYFIVRDACTHELWFWIIIYICMSLFQVQRETQIQAARKTMKSREKRREKTSSVKSSGKSFSAHSKSHKGSHKEMMAVTHGHTKNVPQSRLHEGGSSSKPLSKTHALLQESIAAAEKSSEASAIPQPTAQESGATTFEPSVPRNVGTIKSGDGVQEQMKTCAIDGSTKKKRRRHKIVKREIFSSSENEELDVVTPDGGNASLSVSLKRDLMSDGSDVPKALHEGASHPRRMSHEKITLSTDDLASDVSDADEVMETIKPVISNIPDSFLVRINRDLILTPSLPAVKDRQGHHHEDSDSSIESPSYAVEFNPKKTTKMVIRTQPFPVSDVEDHDHEAVRGDDEMVLGVDDGSKSRAETVMTSSGKKAKRKKKKKHKKITMGKDLKLKITL